MSSDEALHGPPVAGDDCIVCALKCLHECDPTLKAEYTQIAFQLFQSGLVPCTVSSQQRHGLAPERPGRDPKVNFVDVKDLPKRGRAGSLASRQALLHSLVHIECCAIDLAWDIIARFGADPHYAPLPPDFFKDWITVAADEARHFSKLLQRLQSTGMEYGSLAAHDGLWESAMITAHSLPARLAIEHCVHEARGIDILPQTISRFRAGGDVGSADLLEHVIYAEEISHCGAGVRWLKYLYAQASREAEVVESVGGGLTEKVESNGGGGARFNTTANSSSSTNSVDCGVVTTRADWAVDAAQFPSVEEWFHALVRRHFHGLLKPPFNKEARAKAGFGEEWYLPLSVKVDTHKI